MKELWDLFVGFFRASNLGFGGGPAVIPLLKTEAVDHYHWMTNAQFSDAYAAANALPGPIATKMASYIGYQIASWPGALVALAGTILPTVLLLIFAGKLLDKYASSRELKAMLKGVRPVVTALLVVVALDMAKSAFIIKAPLDLATVGIAAVAAAAIYFRNVHPIILIVSSMMVGYLIW
ncbi:Chromate transporter [Syntrophobotulus glycolicus DSM 8271]|uniref:Chromate transporter n=1 Tax=Syntrophobotulus glycolicus (strain DSM 8271 / FlGlyR) TaxID=645991 RepID=F0SY61_SYNGF|nr:chromate transporter [Syntrophobotulus glycolicus]ADY54811.1 Chromate transporter [Syntrophobotulus glycolicus DSM 8271]